MLFFLLAVAVPAMKTVLEDLEMENDFFLKMIALEVGSLKNEPKCVPDEIGGSPTKRFKGDDTALTWKRNDFAEERERKALIEKEKQIKEECRPERKWSQALYGKLIKDDLLYELETRRLHIKEIRGYKREDPVPNEGVYGFFNNRSFHFRENICLNSKGWRREDVCLIFIYTDVGAILIYKSVARVFALGKGRFSMRVHKFKNRFVLQVVQLKNRSIHKIFYFWVQENQLLHLNYKPMEPPKAIQAQAEHAVVSFQVLGQKQNVLDNFSIENDGEIRNLSEKDTERFKLSRYYH